jgi:hypothetical protein
MTKEKHVEVTMTPKKKLLTLALMLVFVFTALSSVGIVCHAETGMGTNGTGSGMPETNVPDTSIGGATGGLDTADGTLIPDVSDMVTNPIAGTESDSLTRAPVTTATPSTSTTVTTPSDSSGGGMGWIGIIITVAVIAAVVIAVLALMPKKQ